MSTLFFMYRALVPTTLYTYTHTGTPTQFDVSIDVQQLNQRLSVKILSFRPSIQFYMLWLDSIAPPTYP